MNTSLLLKQGKLPSWVGAVQVQFAASSYYTVFYSNLMLAATFWYTAGDVNAQAYFPWMNFGIFIGLIALSLIILLTLDYKFMQPARVAFNNRQSCKHDNPAMDKLLEVCADVKQIKRHLGIEET